MTSLCNLWCLFPSRIALQDLNFILNKYDKSDELPGIYGSKAFAGSISYMIDMHANPVIQNW